MCMYVTCCSKTIYCNATNVYLAKMHSIFILCYKVICVKVLLIVIKLSNHNCALSFKGILFWTVNIYDIRNKTYLIDKNKTIKHIFGGKKKSWQKIIIIEYGDI